MAFCSDTDDKILLTYLCWLNLTLLTSWFLSFLFVSLSIRSLTSLPALVFFLLRFVIHSFLLLNTCQILLLVCLFVFLSFFHSVWLLSFLYLYLTSLWSLSLFLSIFCLCVFTSLFLTTVNVSPVPIWRKCNYSLDSISFDSLILFSWPDNIIFSSLFWSHCLLLKMAEYGLEDKNKM